jgi:ABC-type nitrate/sulfonate/bicarbonate transport system substrate-binding protein
MKDLFTLHERYCRHWLKLSGTVSLSLPLLLGLSAWTPARALERIRMGLSVRNVVFLPYYYAQEKRIFEKQGLDAELIQMRRDAR